MLLHVSTPCQGWSHAKGSFMCSHFGGGDQIRTELQVQAECSASLCFPLSLSEGLRSLNTAQGSWQQLHANKLFMNVPINRTNSACHVLITEKYVCPLCNVFPVFQEAQIRSSFPGRLHRDARQTSLCGSTMTD